MEWVSIEEKLTFSGRGLLLLPLLTLSSWFWLLSSYSNEVGSEISPFHCMLKKFMGAVFTLHLYCSISYWLQSSALSPVICSVHTMLSGAYPEEPKLSNYLEEEKPVH